MFTTCVSLAVMTGPRMVTACVDRGYSEDQQLLCLTGRLSIQVHPTDFDNQWSQECTSLVCVCNALTSLHRAIQVCSLSVFRNDNAG